MDPLNPAVLPPGIRSRFVAEVNGLRVHVLEAGFEAVGRPLVLLLHGFPELAYSWRKVMLPLAKAGFHVAAPDQRGYGRTTGWDADYDGDLGHFRLLNAVRMRWGWSRHWATARSRRWWGTISAPRLRRGAPWCDPMCSAR
jgi:pimeloyl-ACP methyl ester carboxylesterase